MNENKAACKVHTTPSTKKRDKMRWCVGCMPSRRRPAHPPCLSSPPHSCSSPTILPSYASFDLVTWHCSGHRELVTLGCWGASLAAGDVAVTWHAWARLSSLSGGGDAALVGRFIGVIGGWVMWRCGVIGGQGHRRAHPSLAQYWAVTGVLDGGGAGCA